MPKRTTQFSLNSAFYCMACGNRGIPIARRKSHQHEKHHRKKIYCLYCKEEINHIECRTAEEIRIFQRNFRKGVYEDEAKASMAYVRNTRLW